MDAGLQCVSRGMTGFRRLTDPCEGDRISEDNGPLRHDRILEISKEKGEKKRLPAINYGHTQCPDPGEDPPKANLRKSDPGTSVWVKHLKRKKVKKKRLPAINYGHTQCPDPGEDPSKANLRKSGYPKKSNLMAIRRGSHPQNAIKGGRISVASNFQNGDIFFYFFPTD